MKTDTRIDWYAFTTNEKRVSFPVGLTKKWEDSVPFRGYTSARRFTDGRLESHSMRKEMGIHVQYSGSCLTEISPTVDGLSVVLWHNALDVKTTRIDLALDIRDGNLDLLALYDDFINRRVESHVKTASKIESTEGLTVYFGSRSSEGFLRVYDKAREQGVEGDWKRAEMEFKGTKARNVVKMLVENDNPSQLIRGLIAGHANFF